MYNYYICVKIFNDAWCSTSIISLFNQIEIGISGILLSIVHVSFFMDSKWMQLLSTSQSALKMLPGTLRALAIISILSAPSGECATWKQRGQYDCCGIQTVASTSRTSLLLFLSGSTIPFPHSEGHASWSFLSLLTVLISNPQLRRQLCRAENWWAQRECGILMLLPETLALFRLPCCHEQCQTRAKMSSFPVVEQRSQWWVL